MRGLIALQSTACEIPSEMLVLFRPATAGLLECARVFASLLPLLLSGWRPPAGHRPGYTDPGRDQRFRLQL